jgi:hypothetical protein
LGQAPAADSIGVARGATFRLLLAVLTLSSLLGPGSASAEPDDAGRVRFVKEANTAFDPYTRAPSGSQAQWMRDHFFRQKTYAPYFDERTGWYPNAWAYKDLYAIYRDSELERARSDWILRDGGGRKLFIPWGCEAGSCPQYAGDITNPAFRAHWIEEARRTLSHGYRGLFIDDVNLEFRVSDGSGTERAPIDPGTGQPMTHGAWRHYVADFVEEIRRALPGVEIAHNPIWFAGHSDPDTARALLAADYIALERGVSDEGLTRGGGRFGFETLLDHVDWLHQNGKAVVWDAYTGTREGAEYNLATYFLTGDGRDGLRTDYRALPSDWWSGYEVFLGAPVGGRTRWNGLWRRDFARGYVLVNEPGAPTRTVHNPPEATDPEGVARPTVTLPAASGAVVVTGTGQSPASRASALTLNVVPNPSRAAIGGTTAVSKRGAPRRLRRAVLIRGRTGKARRGRVHLRVERRGRGAWRVQKSTRMRMRRGRAAFGRVFRRLPAGAYRVSASFRPAGGGAVTRMRRFRLPD